MYITDPPIVDKIVLQENCLSYLLFNIIINTSIKTIDEEKSVVWGTIFATCYHIDTGSSFQMIRPLLDQPNKTGNVC